MSEFTQFDVVRTSLATMEEFRAVLRDAVGGAHVTLVELSLGDDAFFDPAATARAFAELPKPAWFVLGTTADVASLGKVGPALRLRVEEDFSTWSVEARCGDASFAAAVPLSDGAHRSITAAQDVYDPAIHGAELAALAQCLDVDAAALAATMVPDGAEKFAALIGFRNEQMVDLTLDEIPDDTVTFGALGF